MLSPYRVLDLSDERGLLCGQILADLGADVIAVEPPHVGSTARRIGPFFGDAPHRDRSMLWWAYSRNKRSVTLDLTTSQGRGLLLELAKVADFVVESAAPGYLASQGLGYDALSEANPRLIHISISPYGQTGPKADDAATDLTILAEAGVLALMGDEDRVPIRLCIPQAFLHASADAAVGALIALHERARSGRGQQVDVSAQQSVALATQSTILAEPNGAENVKRVAGGFILGKVRIPAVWRVADGFVTLTVLFGQGFAGFTARLVQYLHEQGACDESLLREDWVTYGARLASGEQSTAHYDRLMQSVADFLAPRTKRELFEVALQRKLLLAPIATVGDVLASPHLLARAYWTRMEHPELSESITYPGPFAKFSESPVSYRLRPPLLGEHNAAIFGDVLGLSTKALSQLEHDGVI